MICSKLGYQLPSSTLEVVYRTVSDVAKARCTAPGEAMAVSPAFEVSTRETFWAPKRYRLHVASGIPFASWIPGIAEWVTCRRAQIEV